MTRKVRSRTTSSRPATTRNIWLRVTAVLATFALLLFGGMLALGATTASADPAYQVRLCHATGSQSNPYTTQTVSGRSIEDVLESLTRPNGHGTHSGDIIPPFDGYAGQNWGAGGVIYDNGCQVPEPSPTPTPTPTPTVTPTPTPTPTPTETPVVHRLTICHADGQSGNYNGIEISWSSVNNETNIDWNGHGGHSADIVPPFDSYPGQNWEAGQATLENGCVTPTASPTPTPTPTETSTPTPTPTPTATVTPTPTPTLTPTVTPTPTTTTTTTTTPAETPATVAVTPLPATVEEPVAVAVPPQAATVEEPVAVTVPPQKATVPKAVHAGGGSSAPSSSFPIWAVALMTVSALTAAGAWMRLETTRQDRNS